MADYEDILRIAKILARATSMEPHEAKSALTAAYKRMRRDQVGIKHLLTLPLDELYQESLIKLVTVILEDQANLSPTDRRIIYKNYITLISTRFSNEDQRDPKVNTDSETNYDDLRRTDGENFRQDKMQEEARNKQQKTATEAKNQNSTESSANPQTSQTESITTSTNNFYPAVISVLILGAILWLVLFPSKYDTDLENLEKKRLSEIPAPTLAPAPTPLTHSVAALNANLRLQPTAQSRVLGILKQGQSFIVISSDEKFLKVKLPSGEIGFIARELVIPKQDLERLNKVTAKEYVENRSPEKRIEALLAQSEPQKIAFLAMLYGLTNRSANINNYLTELESAKTFRISADESAATWFAISANTALKSGDLEDAYWKARAAVEADPMNADHHVAFMLANYKLGKYDSVKILGNIVPRLAPKSTNAWMMFALAESMIEGSNEELTKSAFILAIRLSRNTNNTKQYFRDLAANAPFKRTSDLINQALNEEMSDPSIFSSLTFSSSSPSSR